MQLFSALSSIGWMVLILVGGAAVVIGNIGFNIQNAAERSTREKASLATTARNILHPELRYNYTMAASLREGLASDEFRPMRLATGAWEVASHGNLIQALGADEILNVSDVYQHVLNATNYQDRLFDLISGPAAAVSGAEGSRRIILDRLVLELNLAMDAIGKALPPEQRSTLTPPLGAAVSP